MPITHRLAAGALAAALAVWIGWQVWAWSGGRGRLELEPVAAWAVAVATVGLLVTLVPAAAALTRRKRGQDGRTEEG